MRPPRQLRVEAPRGEPHPRPRLSVSLRGVRGSLVLIFSLTRPQREGGKCRSAAARVPWADVSLASWRWMGWQMGAFGRHARAARPGCGALWLSVREPRRLSGSRRERRLRFHRAEIEIPLRSHRERSATQPPADAPEAGRCGATKVWRHQGSQSTKAGSCGAICDQGLFRQRATWRDGSSSGARARQKRRCTWPSEWKSR